MKSLSSSSFITLDIGESHTSLADRVRNSPTADYWVLKDTSKRQPKWYVVPAIPLEESDVNEEHRKKRLLALMKRLAVRLPQTQTIVYRGAKAPEKPLLQPARSGYIVALKGTAPIRVLIPHRSADLHPKQRQVEANLIKASGKYFGRMKLSETEPLSVEEVADRPTSAEEADDRASGQEPVRSRGQAGLGKGDGTRFGYIGASKPSISSTELADLTKDLQLPEASYDHSLAVDSGGGAAAAPAPEFEKGDDKPAPAAVSSAEIARGAMPPPPPPPPHLTARAKPPEGPPPKPSFGQAFPWITPTKEHLVQNTTFDIDVSLKPAPAEDVEGSVHIPVQDRTFEFDVHLLFGNRSIWDKLKFSWAQQTIKKAKYKGLTAPKYEGKRGEPDFRTVRVNFYLEHRWCGEGLKNIEILPRKGAVESKIRKPELPQWRRLLNVTTGCAPPDLLVRIQKLSSGKYCWSFLSPYRNFPKFSDEECQIELVGGAQNYVKTHFEPLAKLTLDQLSLYELEGICKDIYRVTPAAFKQVYWQLRNAESESESKITFKTIQIVSDEPFVPWEIMNTQDDVRAPGMDGEILAVRHSVGRWLAEESSQIRPHIPVHDIRIFASDYQKIDTVETKLPWAEQEATDLVKQYHDKPKADRCPLLTQQVLDFLTSGKAQVLHFSCHGRMDQLDPDASVLILEDNDKGFKPLVVTAQPIQKGIGKQHPLVFLNACQVGGTGSELRFVTGWPRAFLTMGASAVIAPLWSIGDESARAIAEKFYACVLAESPISLGEALKKVRSQFSENKQMTYLAYLLYGDPNTMISVV